MKKIIEYKDADGHCDVGDGIKGSTVNVLSRRNGKIIYRRFVK